ncbi:MAG: TlpA disulfide reductase family protein [Methylococcales bacterium]
MKLKYILTILLLIFVALVILFLRPVVIAAPHLTFTTIYGKKIELSKLKGRPVIVTFWATDCASCIKEIPHLIELYNNFHTKGLEIIAVAMYYDPPNHVLEMSKAKQIPYDVALDLKAEHAFAFGQVQLTPTTFLISPSGDIVMKKQGLLNMPKLQQLIQNLIIG